MEHTLNAEALKSAREKRGWSQKKLADKCKLSPEQVSRWERGKIGRVRADSRQKLIKGLGVDWEELTRAPDDEDETTLPWRRPKVQLNFRVQAEKRTALQVRFNFIRPL